MPDLSKSVKRFVKMYCQKFEGAKKYCKILIDEVHIKPSILYIGNHVVGYRADQMKKAKTMSFLSVCPLFGVPAFVARIIPMYSISDHCTRLIWVCVFSYD